MKTSTRRMAILHILLAVYSVSNVFSKLAADTEFLSWQFVLYYGGVLAILGVYAIGWQQVIKRMPLTTAYANKAVTIVWGILFGMVFFGETVTPLMLLGAFVIVAGIVLYAFEEGRVQDENVRAMNEALSGRDVYTTATNLPVVGAEGMRGEGGRDGARGEGARGGRDGARVEGGAQAKGGERA